ncbi:exodeoxyribonuclease VIII [Leclercia adecarboxylata]|uniref:exodeoxyribonuclease VIII n=1 Tax=Leclercia adecarboxylata TaxID=83655 RepID=UPI002DB8824B|nr:exodeoxyribonuclease VIII [Leclercia adecarboxylata]MEB5748693.1 exodeoxyribonuclease VIII [Leclercia adecarboxylata]
MTVELKVFGGALFAKDKALKENPDLKKLAIFVNAPNKSAAEAIIAGKVAEHYPANMSDYFKAKVWEHREGLPSIEPGAFSTDFFETVAVWNASANEPVAMPQTESAQPDEWAENAAVEEMKTVSKLDQHSRAACLALFGPVTKITSAEYGQVIDLINDDESSFTRELAEALTKEHRSLALAPERQSQLLAWVREKAKDTAQWTDIKKLLVQWIDTPLDKRPQAANSKHTLSGATLGGGNITDRSPDLVHNLSTLGIEIAIALLSMYDEIDIYSLPNRFLMPAKGMAEAEQDPQYTAWWNLLRSTPGILDYSRAAIFALIKSAPGGLWCEAAKLREYINRTLVESNHSKPDQRTIDIACSARPRTISEENKNDETQPPVSGETLPPADNQKSNDEFNAEIDRAMADQQTSEHLAAERGEFVPGNSDPADSKWVAGSAQPKIENLGNGIFSVDALMGGSSNTATALNEREQKIKGLIEAVLAGKTDCFDEEDAQILLEKTGHELSHLAFMIMTDVYAMENADGSETICDYDIQYLAWCAVEEWSDNPETRLDYLTKCLQDYREIDLMKKAEAVPSTPVESKKPLSLKTTETATTYRQQLILAALQGMCANPAYRGDFDDLPNMATMLADGIISQGCI